MYKITVIFYLQYKTFAITNVTILLLLILCIYRLGQVLKILNWVGDRILGLKLLRNPAGLGGKALPHPS